MDENSEQKIVVLGLAKNCGSKILHEINTIKSALINFRIIHWVIIESDSTDKTLEKLSKLSSTIPNFKYITLGKLEDTLPERTDRMAHCRNKYLEIFEREPAYQEAQYVLIADLDGVNSCLTAEAINSCWDQTQWDVCTANQAGPYYDIWALRHPMWAPNDCWDAFEFLRKIGASREEALNAAVYGKMVCIPPQSNWIEVDSAFGGLAIYKKEILCGLRYEKTQGACEHVQFHEKIRSKGGRIFINPNLINSGINEHSKNVCGLPRFLHELKFFIRQLWISN